MLERTSVPVSLYTSAGQRKYLTPGERSRFIAAAWACPRAELRTLCLTLAYTGCRISEALALTAASIEIEGGFIALRSLKKRGSGTVIRTVPVPAELIAELQNVHGLTVSAVRLWTFSRSRAWQLVKGVMRDAGVGPGIHATPKGLRHGFGVHAVLFGHVPLNFVQRWLGHARMETTSIYLQAVGPEERLVASRMWDRWGALRSVFFRLLRFVRKSRPRPAFKDGS